MIDIATLPPVLTKEEIRVVTRCRTRDKIIQCLNVLGIPFKVAHDGYPVVSRLAYEQAMGVEISAKTKAPKLHLEN